jgi:hypothetical protein
MAQVLKPKIAYGGHQPMAPVASGTTPIQAHTGPPMAAQPTSPTPASNANYAVDAANVQFHGVLLEGLCNSERI